MRTTWSRLIPTWSAKALPVTSPTASAAPQNLSGVGSTASLGGTVETCGVIAKTGAAPGAKAISRNQVAPESAAPPKPWVPTNNVPALGPTQMAELIDSAIIGERAASGMA